MLKSICIVLKLCSTLSGPATVIDGDTIIVEGIHVRLRGLDAEELSEPNGLLAKTAMQKLVGHEIITCKLDGSKSYDRYVGTCYYRSGINDLVDIAIAMVASGQALDCAHYSHGRYRKYEPDNIRLILKQKGYC